MTPRENLLAAFRRQETQWIPWVPLLGGRANLPVVVPPEVRERCDLRRRGGYAEIGLYEQALLGCDILLDEGVFAGRYRTARQETTRQGDLETTITELGGRRLVRRTRQCRENAMQTSGTIEYALKDERDIGLYLDLLDDEEIEFAPTAYRQARERIGEQGVVTVAMDPSPLMQCILYLMGLENFIYAQADWPEATAALLDKLDRRNERKYRELFAADLEFEVIRITEDQSTLLISPQLHRERLTPSLRRTADLCHAQGKLLMMHTCGHVREFLPEILAAGVDAHHYLAEPPVGNTPLEAAREVWGEQVTAMVAACPITLCQGTPAQVEANAENILAQAGSSRALMIMCGMKPDMPAENLYALQKALWEPCNCAGKIRPGLGRRFAA